MKTKVFQKQNNNSKLIGGNGSGNARIADNRTESVAQRKLAESIQKQADEEELLQGKFTAQLAPEEEKLMQGKLIQRAPEDEEELMQGKFPVQRVENNTGMPDNLKSGIENLSGHDMSDVKVHYNSDKPASVQAHAYAQGTNIHLGPGQDKHLPHEAWHVVQQVQGRVQPTTSVNGMAVNDSPSLENEADVMGARAANME